MFGVFLGEELQRRGWTMRRFAGFLEVGPGTVSRWVRGQRTPSPDDCVRIAGALRIEPAFVLREAGYAAQQPTEAAELQAQLFDLQIARLTVQEELEELTKRIDDVQLALRRLTDDAEARRHAQMIAQRVIDAAVSHAVRTLRSPTNTSSRFDKISYQFAAYITEIPEREAAVASELDAILQQELAAALDEAWEKELTSRHGHG